MKQTVLGGTPEQWGYDTALWTRAILAELVDQRLGVKVSEPTVGRYLHELGLSPQVPDWKAHEQDPEAVRRFVEEKYPRIVRLAKKTGAQIYFLDESGCRATEHRPAFWPELDFGHQPRRPVALQSFEHSIRSAEVIEFLSALLKGSDQPIIVVMDNHSMHFSAAIKAFARPRRQRLKLFSLPTYSPECNCYQPQCRRS